MYNQDMNLEASPALGGQCAPMLGGSMAKAPSTPWMPFSMLFAAISTKVPRENMDMINNCYEEFKVCCSVLTFSVGSLPSASVDS
jgi:hypothetical protein